MASQFDLQPRIERLQAAGLTVASDYKGAPPKWLTTALNDSDAHVLNCKGTRPDDTVVLLKLSKLEQILIAAGDSQIRVVP
jgi:hypothetical protein